MNILLCSVGRRVELLKEFRNSLDSNDKIIAVDLSNLAPALYVADTHYIVPRIDDPKYLESIIDICNKERVNAITTLIDPEIELLSKNRTIFENLGIEVLAPYVETAKLCFDKYEMYKFLKAHGISTIDTWDSYETAIEEIDKGLLSFPVFVKPRKGSGSVGARKVEDIETLKKLCDADPTLIIQRLMDGIDLDADVYIDTISHKAVSAAAT